MAFTKALKYPAAARKVRSEEKKVELIRRINDMMPVPDLSALDIVLSLKTRLLAARTANLPLSDETKAMIRQLIADLVTTVASMGHLAKLFEASEDIRDVVAAAHPALVGVARRWKASLAPGQTDLDVLDNTVDLFYNMLRQTKLSEYKTVLELVEKELTRPQDAAAA